MGTKRVGLARTQALIENLARSISMSNTTLTNLETVRTATLESTGEMIYGIQTVAAAGSDQAGATEISAGGGTLVTVTGAGSNKGVKLPALSGVNAGVMFVIVNTNASNTLEIYPNTGDKILPAADNAGITVAASTGLILWKADDDSWYGFEPAVIGA